jgi:arsenite methyltransferase
MFAKAGNNTTKAAVHNASFVSSCITAIEISDTTADVVISNCALKLVPHIEEHLVLKEMFKLLKPDGRLAISVIMAKRTYPSR